jgi:hypothetical protein
MKNLMIMVLTVAMLKFFNPFCTLLCFTVSFNHLLSEFYGADIVLLWCYAVDSVEIGLATAKVDGNNRV